MHLRALEQRDAPLMLEWMHDASVVRDLKTRFADKTLEDCRTFIARAADDLENRHFAIADDEDQYMGTVSLKHIESDAAEFGITVRACAMGKGFSHFGMRKIIEYGFSQLGLKLIYWCVDPRNQRAVRIMTSMAIQGKAMFPAWPRDTPRMRYNGISGMASVRTASQWNDHS